MVEVLQSPAQATYGLISGHVLFLILNLLGLTCFAYIVAKRLVPLVRGECDFRFDRPLVRLERVLKFWLGQWKHPRYRFAGTVHIFIFAGFIILATRAFSLLILGVSENFALPDNATGIAHFYEVIADYAASIVFACMIVAAVRRIVFKPARYEVPAKYGTESQGRCHLPLGADRNTDVLGKPLRGEQGCVTRTARSRGIPGVFSLAWVLQSALSSASPSTLWNLHRGAYLLDVLTFYFLLCYRPFGIQFHVETSLFNVFFAKLDKGTVKPVRWGVSDEQLDQVKSFGVKKFEDFTWKHMLDFYSCADCGRCSDNCPANAAGRPLSPRFLTIKARDYSFQNYPMFGKAGNGTPLIGSIYSDDEVWSCTTCGACEEECPLLIEYIDKIVDLRRGLVDDGNVPKSIQKALRAIESRGNPYGKMEKKRADWTKAESLPSVAVLNGKNGADMLYFVDSITSYDDRIQAIGRATVRILTDVGENFAILGANEKDSGHDVRRFGEETLFMALRDHNVEAIKASGVRRIVTADPHAYNALKHDYKDVPPVEHISQVMAREVKNGNLKLNPVDNDDKVYAYHDPCYLGRHNQVYDEPREVLDAIPGLKRVEMSRCRDRSFCCGGGGLMLFYEPKEDERMGVKRVRMAAEAGANVIVTACPFCMVNMEDAIKVAGMEGKMTAIDLAELLDQQVAREGPKASEVREEYVAV